MLKNIKNPRLVDREQAELLARAGLLLIFSNKFEKLDTLIRGEVPSACQLGSPTYYYLSVLMDKLLF